jgi:hypothetical protein
MVLGGMRFLGFLQGLTQEVIVIWFFELLTTIAANFTRIGCRGISAQRLSALTWKRLIMQTGREATDNQWSLSQIRSYVRPLLQSRAVEAAQE